MQNAVTFETELKQLIRDVPDFPEAGILFRDITPLLADGDAFRRVIDTMAEPFAEADFVVSIESRGFILGAPIAYRLGCGLVPVRKSGRLPAETVAEAYSLEYGADSVEIHRDALESGAKILIVDDLLATGGTVRAAINLTDQLGAELLGVSVMIELAALDGRSHLPGVEVHSLITY